MALNWAMLDPSHRPVPLPSEKVLLSTSSVSLQLFAQPPGAAPSVQPQNNHTTYTVDRGTLYTTNKRIVFVAPGAKTPSSSASGGGHPASSSAATGSLAAGQASIAPDTATKAAQSRPPLETLSVPYRQLVDGRLVQPWFTSTYYEATCLPGEGGGLSEPHLLRLYFKESGGFDFQQTVSEMRDRLEVSGRRGTGNMEDLPAYTPASSSASAPAASTPSSAAPANFAAPTPAAPLPPPSPSMFAAAQVARDAERDEAQERERVSGVREGEAPPGYED
ncbi:hypothetical protein JCM10207_008159 [Rhodosporidiobolus poonsookiae]